VQNEVVEVPLLRLFDLYSTIDGMHLTYSLMKLHSCPAAACFPLRRNGFVHGSRRNVIYRAYDSHCQDRILFHYV
jgi:hypothetical protein